MSLTLVSKGRLLQLGHVRGYTDFFHDANNVFKSLCYQLVADVGIYMKMGGMAHSKQNCHLKCYCPVKESTN